MRDQKYTATLPTVTEGRGTGYDPLDVNGYPLVSATSRQGTAITWQVPVTTGAISILPAWVTGTGYSLGQLVTNDSGKVYQCRTAGTSGAPAGGPTGVTADITDGTVHWRYIAASATFKGSAIIRNLSTSAAVVFYGPSTVTTTNGAELPAGQSDPLLEASLAAIFAVCASTATLTIVAYQ